MLKQTNTGPKQTNTWLEPLLTRELRRIPAPRSPLPISSRAPRRPAGTWFACTSAAGLLLASAVGLHAYITNGPSLTGRQAAKAARFETWVRASTGLNVHAACQLCHADEELRAGISRDWERSLAGAFPADAGVY
jgi:hypothetical protein